MTKDEARTLTELSVAVGSTLLAAVGVAFSAPAVMGAATIIAIGAAVSMWLHRVGVS
jgi:hypothetical protein